MIEVSTLIERIARHNELRIKCVTTESVPARLQVAVIVTTANGLVSHGYGDHLDEALLNAVGGCMGVSSDPIPRGPEREIRSF